MRTTRWAGVLAVCLVAAGVARADPKQSGLGALEAARQKLDACAEKTHKSGTAKIHLKLAQDGTTSEVKVSGTGSADLDKCIANVLSTSTFSRGISFTIDVGLAIPTSGSSSDAPKVPAAGPSPGDTLDRVGFDEGIAKVKAKIMACGDGSKGQGNVKVNVKVAPDGTVVTVTAHGSTDAKVNTCVGDAIKKATFAKTTSGGAFAHSFVLAPTTGTSSAIEPKDITGDLDRAAITDGVAKVKAKIDACYQGGFGRAVIGAKTQVAASGKVTSVTTDGLTDDKLKNCVADVMKTATFKATKNGGSFRYPFAFGKVVPPVDMTTASAISDADETALDRSMISDGITKVKAAVSACGNGNKTKGIVKIKVVVAPAGTVSSSTVTQTPDEALGKCVAGAISKATFAKTGQGGTFSYPFVF